MEQRLKQILDSVPLDEPRSRLEPYRELILHWRRQGRSYHRIRQLLSEHCDIKVAYVTLYRFVQRRSRPRRMDGLSETPSPVDGAIRLNEECLRSVDGMVYGIGGNREISDLNGFA